MATKNYSKQKQLSSSNSRVYADVRLINPQGILSGIISCLVDTGSDYTILPQRIATALSIIPSNSVSIITSAGTSILLQAHPNLDLEIEGYLLSNVQVLFSPSQQFMPILGRIDLIDTFDFGFDSAYWHFG